MIVHDKESGLYIPSRQIIHPRGINPRIERPRFFGSQQVMLAQRISGSVTSSPLVTGQTPGSPRTDFSGDLGFAFDYLSAINITSLGRWILSGNNQTHTLTLYDKTAGAIAVTVTLNTSGKPANAFAYSTSTVIGSLPYALIAGRSYTITSNETSGQDSWSDAGPITVAAVISNVLPAVGVSGGSGGSNQSYVPTSAEYN